MITLTGTYGVTKILKPTSAQLFSLLQVGDFIKLSVEIKPVTKYRGVYATNIVVTTKRYTETGVVEATRTLSMTMLAKVLDNFELYKVN